RLFDHLVGAGEQLVRHSEAEQPRGLGVDDQLELGRLQDWQVGRLRSLEDATGIGPNLTVRIRNFGSIGHQPAGFGIVAIGISRGNPIACRQSGKLHAAAGEEGVVANEKSIGSLAHKTCEGRINLAAGAGVEKLDLQSHGASSRLHVSQRDLCVRSIGRVGEQSNTSGCGHQLAQESEPLCYQPTYEKIDTGRVAAWPGKLGDKAELDRIVGNCEAMGIVVVAALAAKAEGVPPVTAMTATCRRTNWAASAGSRSYWPSAHRYSIATFSPSTKPASFSPWRNARKLRSTTVSGDVGLRNPIT